MSFLRGCLGGLIERGVRKGRERRGEEVNGWSCIRRIGEKGRCGDGEGFGDGWY
jgi:hypothetical protein